MLFIAGCRLKAFKIRAAGVSCVVALKSLPYFNIEQITFCSFGINELIGGCFKVAFTMTAHERTQ